MSIELPEASILASQMQKAIAGKRISGWHIEELEKLQKSKMVSENLKGFDDLVGKEVASVASRGNTIRVKVNQERNLILSPEYGGAILFHEEASSVPKKIHLRLDFEDGTILTVRLKGWGAIYPLGDNELHTMYTYARDFSDIVSPNDPAFTQDFFVEKLGEYTKNIKMALVGKEAVIVGIQNSAFQDIIYRACIHPKRRASDLTKTERRNLYDAVIALIDERLKMGGKDKFTDLYGKQGSYVPVMGPNMKEAACPKCGSAVEKLAHGGGHVYLCSTCQKLEHKT
jgi:formamidopyrimidine-DNA glycosylase